MIWAPMFFPPPSWFTAWIQLYRKSESLSWNFRIPKRLERSNRIGFCPMTICVPQGLQNPVVVWQRLHHSEQVFWLQHQSSVLSTFSREYGLKLYPSVIKAGDNILKVSKLGLTLLIPVTLCYFNFGGGLVCCLCGLNRKTGSELLKFLHVLC